MRFKVTKQQWKKMKSAQAIVAKKAKNPDFLKTLPEAEKTVSKWKI